MDDIDLKKIWSKTDESASNRFDSTGLNQIIDRGSASIISKFIHAMKFEMWINIIILCGLSIYLAIQSKWSFAIFWLLINIAFATYYISLIRKLKKEIINTNVLEYLCVVYQVIIRFISHYKVANIILAVPLFTTGMYLANPEIFTHEYLSNGWFIVLVFASFAVAILLFYIILYQMYGKKANKIKLLIEELKQEEDSNNQN